MLVPVPEHQLEPVALDVEVVVPVHNEEQALALSIQRLHRYLSRSMPFSWRIVIADNASSDATPEIAQSLTVALRGVSVLRLEQKGRGRALRAAWSHSTARVVAYMDVDLSTDLRALLPLVSPLLSGHSEVAIGTRLARFVVIGAGSTLAYAVLFVALAGTLGSRGANVTALTLTAVANTVANRRFTFGGRGRRRIVRDQLGGLLVYAIALALTDLSLVLLHRLDPRPARLLEVSVLVLASLGATVARYVGMSTWLFAGARGPLRKRGRKSIRPLSTQGS
jgi:putative flippase GtrA